MPRREKPPPLCALCVAARDNSPFNSPMHLVHPLTGDHMLFDVRGMAVCPTCGARWRRVRNAFELAE